MYFDFIFEKNDLESLKLLEKFFSKKTEGVISYEEITDFLAKENNKFQIDDRTMKEKISKLNEDVFGIYSFYLFEERVGKREISLLNSRDAIFDGFHKLTKFYLQRSWSYQLVMHSFLEHKVDDYFFLSPSVFSKKKKTINEYLGKYGFKIDRKHKLAGNELRIRKFFCDLFTTYGILAEDIPLRQGFPPLSNLLVEEFSKQPSKEEYWKMVNLVACVRMDLGRTIVQTKSEEKIQYVPIATLNKEEEIIWNFSAYCHGHFPEFSEEEIHQELDFILIAYYCGFRKSLEIPNLPPSPFLERTQKSIRIVQNVAEDILNMEWKMKKIEEYQLFSLFFKQLVFPSLPFMEESEGVDEIVNEAPIVTSIVNSIMREIVRQKLFEDILFTKYKFSEREIYLLLFRPLWLLIYQFYTVQEMERRVSLKVFVDFQMIPERKFYFEKKLETITDVSLIFSNTLDESVDIVFCDYDFAPRIEGVEVFVVKDSYISDVLTARLQSFCKRKINK